MRVLHLLSQRPDSTGSGTMLQAILTESEKFGHENMVVAGMQEGYLPVFPGLSHLRTRFVTFGGGDLPFPIPGMSDVMPYPSMRFSDLTDRQLSSYRDVFKTAVLEAAARFRPDIIHSNHLWLVTSLARRILPGIPMVATCHGTDLRQMHTCPRFRQEVVSGCSGLDGVFAALFRTGGGDTAGLRHSCRTDPRHRRRIPERTVCSGREKDGYPDNRLRRKTEPRQGGTLDAPGIRFRHRPAVDAVSCRRGNRPRTDRMHRPRREARKPCSHCGIFETGRFRGRPVRGEHVHPSLPLRGAAPGTSRGSCLRLSLPCHRPAGCEGHPQNGGNGLAPADSLPSP